MIEVGKRAPAFSLKNEAGEAVKLSEHKGYWVVLYFYPKDNTPGCTIQACEFTAGIEDFDGLDAYIYGCSPDSIESHQRFIEARELGISLLSDPDHKVMEKYAAWGEKVLYGKTSVGVIRSTVIIDPTGKVAALWKRVKSKGHAEKVREKLAELVDAASE